MNRVALLAGSFLITFALLSTVWMFSFGSRSGARSDPTPTVSSLGSFVALPATTAPAATRTLSATSAPETTRPTTSARPSSTPVPLRTPPPTVGPPTVGLPTGGTGTTQTYFVAGNAFVSSEIPDGGSVRPAGNGVVLETTSDSPDALWLTYKLDTTLLPTGVPIAKVDAAICGQGEGQFWEVYGPVGGSPTEYEVEPPDADGCWHFMDAPADDLSVLASTMLDSRLYVEKVEYTVTFAR